MRRAPGQFVLRVERLEPRSVMAVATLTTDVLYQTMEGFGTHLNADESLRDPALLAAYRDAGFSMVRLEVTPGLYTANRSGDLTIPVPIEADYDANIRRFDFERGGWADLDDAIRWLKVNSFEPERFRLSGSVWSPPHWLKEPTGTLINWTNWDGTARSNYGPFLPYGPTGGNSGGGRVKPENYQAMARWVLSFVKGYSEFVGVPIDSFSFQNEPDYEGFYNTTSYGRRAVDPADPTKGYVTDWTIYADAFQAIVNELAAHPEITTRMIGPEIMTVSPWANSNSDRVRQALLDKGLLSQLDVIGAHGYESVTDSARGWNTFWTRYADTGKPIYQTETSGERQIWRDAVDAAGKPVEGGLALAVKISNALVHGRVSAYEYWSFSNTNEGSSLVQPANRATPTVDPKYSAMAQFSRFIRPGSRRIDATFENGATAIGGATPLDAHAALNVASFYHPTDRHLTTVLVNRRATAESVTIRVPARLTVPSMAVHRTSDSERMISLPSVAAVNGEVTISVPAFSVVTLTGLNTSTDHWTVGVPAGWSAADVGGPAVAGRADSLRGRWTIHGAGTDIWGTSDQFHFASTTVWRDVSITARVESVQNTNVWAKAGVMLRASADPASAFVAVYQMPNNEVSFQWRAATGAAATFSGARHGGTAAKHVRLTRTGDVFRAWYSFDRSTWIEIGAGVTVALPETVRAGLAVTSRSSSTTCRAEFTDVAVAVANAAPTVAAPSAALAASATAAELDVVATDDYPTADLMYEWLMTAGPAAVRFSTADGGRRATASFSSAGSYAIAVTVRDRGGLATTRSVTVSVPQNGSSLAVEPAAAVVAAGSSRIFTAVVRDQFMAPLTTQPALTWAVVAGVGAIDVAGRFSSPGSGRAAIRAEGGGLSSSVVVAAVDPGTLATTRQAETAALSGGSIAASTHNGHRGTGYADFPGSGGRAEFTAVDGGSGGETVAWIRYALGSTTARSGRLTVNGVATTITFPPTGAWSTWQSLAVPLVLNPGSGNTLMIESTGQDLANIDEIQVANPSGLPAVFETIDVPSGTTRVDRTVRSGPLGLRKGGGGTLVLVADGPRGGPTVVTGGELVVRSSAASGAGLEIASGAGVTLETPDSFAVESLVLSPGGILRLAGGSLSVPAAALAPRDLRSRLVDGQDGLRGIAVTKPGSLAWRVGWRYDADRLHLAPALAGDLNLDGVVDVIDIAELVSSGAYDAANEASWSAGDGNHDGVVDILDIAEMLQGDAYDRGAYGTIPQATMTLDESSVAALAFASFDSPATARRSPRFAR
jgi:O-glycosyl hydrolase/regulation of enolase protein 1 (concanavalin A-like superfamily)